MAESLIKFTRGVPATESFPVGQLARCAEAVLSKYSDEVLQYGPAGGFPALRQFLAGQFGVDENRVIIGQGSLQLQDLCARMLVKPGDVVYVEEPTYDRTLAVLRRAGAQVVGFPLMSDGLDTDEFETRLKRGESPALLYIIPDFQNPSGSVLSVEKRHRIADLAREHRFWIIEDSPYRKLRYRGQDAPTLFDLAPERVLHMSSYSKLISPGLRVGYVITPEPLADQLAGMAEDTYISPSFLNQAIVYEFEGQGWLEPQIETLKALYQPRLEAMLQSLDKHMTGKAGWNRPDGGFFIGLTLKADVRAEVLVKHAAESGLALTDGRGFFPRGGGDTFIRLPFCALTPEEIEAGIARLAQVV